MSELPKIALARLRAKADPPKPSGVSAGPPAFGGEAHPDANILAAFAEKSLTDRERSEVLSHLSECADCREIASFIVPADALGAEPACVPAASKWNPWPILRWGALAAVLGVLTIVAIHTGSWKQNREISKSTPPPNPVGSMARIPPPASPPPSVPEISAQGNTPAQAQTSASGMAQAQAARARQQDAAQDQALTDRLTRLRAARHSTVMTAVRPPAALRAVGVPATRFERRESMGYESRSAMAGRPAAPTVAPAPPTSAPAASAKSGDKSIAASDQLLRSQSAAVTAGAETARATESTPNVTSEPTAAPAPAPTPKATPAAKAQANTQITAQASPLAMGSFGSARSVQAEHAAAVWRITASGKVQRSADGARSFKRIHVAHGVKFQAVASSGDSVWAGGTGGALYHSTDSGASWTQIAITSEGNTMTEPIAAIQLAGPQHLSVTTSSGAVWASEDNGGHWQKQP